MSAARASVLLGPFVTLTSVGLRRSRVRSASTSRTSSALSPDWLTAISSVSARIVASRKCSSSAVSTIDAGTPCVASWVTGE